MTLDVIAAMAVACRLIVDSLDELEGDELHNILRVVSREE